MNDELESIAITYFNLHNEIAASKIILEQYCEEFEPEEDELKQNSIYLSNTLSDILKNRGQVSNLLKKQLLMHYMGLGEKFEINIENHKISVIEYFHTNELLDLILLIEEGKISGKPFNNKGKLKELLHIHHGAYSTFGFSAILNCINYWYNPHELGKIKRNKIEGFKKLISEHQEHVPSKMYDIAIKAKSKQGLTGEWLIYKKHNEINYFLCLAKHDEGDENILENKIKPCLEEFPELLNREEKI